MRGRCSSWGGRRRRMGGPTTDHVSARTRPSPLDVCLNCCVSEKVERELREWPLAEITARHLYDYNTSAKGLVQPVKEVKHLLPRMLELLSEGEQIHHSIELSLDRLGLCPD